MHCENCKIKFETDTGCCPLCHEKIAAARYENRTFPPRPKIISRKAFSVFTPIYFFISFIAVVVAGIVNYIAQQKFTWSAVVLCSLIYIYTLIKNTVLAKTELAFKMLLQAVLMSLLLYAIDYFGTNNQKWSLQYAIPFFLVAVTLSLTLLAFSHYNKWRDYLMSILVMVIIGLVPFVFYLTKIITVYWPSLISFLYSVFTVTGMLIFYRRKFTNELKKNFHI